MREKINCPNCGAPINDTKCPYCGTAFYDFSSLEIGKISYFRINAGGTHRVVRAMPLSMEVEVSSDNAGFYCDNLLASIPDPEIRFSLDFECLPDDKGVYMISRRMEEEEE